MIRPPAPEEAAAARLRTGQLLDDQASGTLPRRNLDRVAREWLRERKAARARWEQFEVAWLQWQRYNRRGGSYARPSSWVDQLCAWHMAGLTVDVFAALLDEVMAMGADSLAVDEDGYRSRWSTLIALVARTVDELAERDEAMRSIGPLERARRMSG